MDDSSSSGPSDIDINSESDWTPNNSDLLAAEDDSDFDDSDRTIVDDLTLSLSIQPISKKRSRSGLWQHFGCLTRNGKVIKKCASRYFCKMCIENNSLKR